MLGRFFKSLFFSQSNKADKTANESIGKKLAVDLKENSGGFIDFVAKKTNELKEEFFVVKDKLNNLLETNYQLGLKHLKNDHLNEAIFRFRFIKKFWPDHLDSYYQLAYCLVLKNEFNKSKKVLEELIAKNPNYGDHVKELLDMMNAAQGQEQASESSIMQEQKSPMEQEEQNQTPPEKQIMQDNQQVSS
jgi:tetratricopeptide (TPR) repeat protein